MTAGHAGRLRRILPDSGAGGRRVSSVAEILAFLVDLRLRGDLGPNSWAYVRDAVVANKLEDLQPLVADPKKHKTHFYNNYNRYVARCHIVGATPVTEKEWGKK